MATEKQKMMRARDILNSIIEGNDPFTGSEIDEQSFLHDARMIRCLHYVVRVLTNNIENEPKKGSLPEFYITEEELSNVQLPEEEIGISSFCKAVNQAIDLGTRKKLTGVKLNNQLKKMGILTTVTDDEGKSRTTMADGAEKYGLKLAHVSYNGREYDKIVYTDEGKQFLLKNLLIILDYSIEEE